MESTLGVKWVLICAGTGPDLSALRRLTPTESDITIAKVMDAVKRKHATGVEVSEKVRMDNY